MPPEEKMPIEKLPKWAQSHISQLEYQVRELRGQMEVAQKVSPVSKFGVRRYTTIDHKIWYMPEESRAQFTLNKDGGYLDVGIDLNYRRNAKEDALIVYAHGAGELLVKPHAGNTVQLLYRA